MGKSRKLIEKTTILFQIFNKKWAIIFSELSKCTYSSVFSIPAQYAELGICGSSYHACFHGP